MHEEKYSVKSTFFARARFCPDFIRTLRTSHRFSLSLYLRHFDKPGAYYNLLCRERRRWFIIFMWYACIHWTNNEFMSKLYLFIYYEPSIYIYTRMYTILQQFISGIFCKSLISDQLESLQSTGITLAPSIQQAQTFSGLKKI